MHTIKSVPYEVSLETNLGAIQVQRNKLTFHIGKIFFQKIWIHIKDSHTPFHCC